MYELGDLYKLSQEMDIFTMGKGGGSSRKDKNVFFFYLDSEQYLKKVVSSYYSLVNMCCQNLCTYS